MKKFMFIMPLMAVSLLSGCGGGSKDPVIHTLKFVGTHCEMHDESGKTVLQKEFEAGQTASFFLVGASEEFEIPKEANVKLTITGTDDPFDGIFSYNEVDGSFSVKMTADITVTATSEAKPVDPYKVSEEEFNAACGFKDINYLQVTEIREDSAKSSQENIDLSPTVSYSLYKDSELTYREEYVSEKDDGTYCSYYREVEGDNFDYKDRVYNFLTPQSKQINVLAQLTESGISYDSFTYNEAEGIYTAKIVEQPGAVEIYVFLKFIQKKVVSYSGSVAGALTQTNTYTYEENTPALPTMKKWYDCPSWWKYCSCGLEGVEATENDIRKVVKLKVNGIDHEVRLIDVDKDVDANGNTIHCTFEFANEISDENGYSLATYWNDTAIQDGSSYDYTKSTIRKALNGGDGDINWFRYYGFQSDGTEDPRNLEFAKEDQYKISVLDMINNENKGFKDVLKAPSKYINIWNDEKQPEAGWEEQTVYDKIFLLSPAELGRTSHENEESKTTAYSFYEGHSGEQDEIRAKKQVKEGDGARNDQVKVTSGMSGSDKFSSAGYYNTIGESGYSYLRSPHTVYEDCAWNCAEGGYLVDGCPVYREAHSIAPAFCI